MVVSGYEWQFWHTKVAAPEHREQIRPVRDPGRTPGRTREDAWELPGRKSGKSPDVQQEDSYLD